MAPNVEAFLSGASKENDAIVPVEKPSKRVKAVPTLKKTPALVVAPEPESDPEKKWAAKFKLSTIDLIEQRFHAYYTPDKGRLSKRDIVEILLVDAIKDDARVLALLGKPPQG
jgi:hypothetical protein